MPVISFQFSGTADRGDQDRLLGRLKKMAGVKTAGRIDAESEDEDILRMCFAETVDASHLPSIIEQLHHAPGVEGVSVEPRRGLA